MKFKEINDFVNDIVNLPTRDPKNLRDIVERIVNQTISQAMIACLQERECLDGSYDFTNVKWLAVTNCLKRIQEIGAV